MTFTITTPLYYVNDRPHLGSTYTTLAADTLARFQRLLGKQVNFITGVDEHGQKIERTANQNKISPLEHCDYISATYIDLWKEWNISHDKFVRTTSSSHKQFVKKFFERVVSSGDIYMGNQQGWYCVGCEEFKDVSKDNNDPICDIHKKPLEWRDEENLFFRLSKYQEQIELLINSKDFIQPKARQNEVSNFVLSGLKDFSISRVNISWGIEVPGHKGHTFYVWFDALLGYISALYDTSNLDSISELNIDGWPASIHIIGKDILRFHAVYWPAMLLSAGLPLPKKVFGHGFLTREGQKMGKSLGNILDPKVLIDQYNAEAVRWYLLRDFQFGQDGDFQHKRFVDLVNNDLANTIGNLLNRTSTMARKWFNNSVPDVNRESIVNHQFSAEVKEYVSKYLSSMEELRFDKSCQYILSLATSANVYLNENAPWKKIKEPDSISIVAVDLYVVLESVRIVGYLLAPLLPKLSQSIKSQLAINDLDSNFVESLRWGILVPGTILPIPEPIIEKIDVQK